MSGHSKWANIKHKKGAADAKKGRIFSKLAKEIMVAVKQSGKEPDTNPKLRMCLTEATGLPVFIADDPLHAVANGTGIILQDVDRMAKAMALAED